MMLTCRQPHTNIDRALLIVPSSLYHREALQMTSGWMTPIYICRHQSGQTHPPLLRSLSFR